MSLHACSVTNSWFGRRADFQSAAYSGNQRFVQREPQWLLLLSFLSKRLVVMSMKLLLRGDAANTAFNLLHEAPICDSFFSLHPIHKAIIDTATQSHLVNKGPCTDGKSFDIETRNHIGTQIASKFSGRVLCHMPSFCVRIFQGQAAICCSFSNIPNTYKLQTNISLNVWRKMWQGCRSKRIPPLSSRDEYNSPSC